MATEPYEPEPVPTRVQQLASIFGTAKVAITGSDRIPLRIVVLFVVGSFLAAWGQAWWWSDPVVVVCLLLLAFSWRTE